MANFFEQKDRRVIPNWRSFKRTVISGELGYGIMGIDKIHYPKLSLNDYLHSWKNEKSIAIAGDLLSAAFVNNMVDNQHVQSAAKFVLSNSPIATKSLVSMAEIILEKEEVKINTHQMISDLKEIAEPNSYNKKIREYKGRIEFAPFNPINYANLSRIYAILGIKEKATRNMKIALHLGKENRFILRAATRLFSHFDEEEYAHEILKRSDLVNTDPWVTSSEIALATLLNRKSDFIKKGQTMIHSQNFDWYSLTELASSIGTFELFKGSFSKAKKMLRNALISPNDNSLAQIEWINNKVDSIIDINPNDFEICNNSEAKALNNYHSGNYEIALNQSIEWFIDIPFSKRPVMLGSHIANIFLENPKIAIQLLEAGLISHPNDPQIINNLAYSYVLENQIQKAEDYILMLKEPSKIPLSTKICLIATQGLIAFRKGNNLEGSRLYEEAIDHANRLNLKQYSWLARLNYANELILTGTDQREKILNLIKIPEHTPYSDINFLKQRITNNLTTLS